MNENLAPITMNWCSAMLALVMPRGLVERWAILAGGSMLCPFPPGRAP